MDNSIEDKTLEIQKTKRDLMVSTHCSIEVNDAGADRPHTRTWLSPRRRANEIRSGKADWRTSNSCSSKLSCKCDLVWLPKSLFSLGGAMQRPTKRLEEGAVLPLVDRTTLLHQYMTRVVDEHLPVVGRSAVSSWKLCSIAASSPSSSLHAREPRTLLYVPRCMCLQTGVGDAIPSPDMMHSTRVGCELIWKSTVTGFLTVVARLARRGGTMWTTRGCIAVSTVLHTAAHHARERPVVQHPPAYPEIQMRPGYGDRSSPEGHDGRSRRNRIGSRIVVRRSE